MNTIREDVELGLNNGDMKGDNPAYQNDEGVVRDAASDTYSDQPSDTKEGKKEGKDYLKPPVC